ncbi:ABC transporter ATP-binding protein [Clostridium oceanicum]|uniref:ABC transporter ATP-binding protein n=1 Tax=Clostridium oceanicum TaxID=1543 RepID=A0ABN1JUE8_9CLOT
MYKVKNLCKAYGNLKVLDNFNLEFTENKITSILGPSGCGKTTLLNIITGLIKEYRGEVIGFKGEDISFVFQEDRLIEWKTIYKNIEFVLKDKIHDKRYRDEIILKSLDIVNMLEYKNYYPGQLSGGMRQRVAIARALVCNSPLIIMDEPFKSLDVKSKSDIIHNILKKKDSIKNKTIILVTHDIEEALELSDYIVILKSKPTKVKKIIRSKDYNDKNGLKEEVARKID